MFTYTCIAPTYAYVHIYIHLYIDICIHVTFTYEYSLRLFLEKPPALAVAVSPWHHEGAQAGRP